MDQEPSEYVQRMYIRPYEREIEALEQRLVDAKAFEAFVQKFGDYRKAFTNRVNTPPPHPNLLKIQYTTEPPFGF